MSTERGLSSDTLAAQARELLGGLIRFNTVNPPGDERPAQQYLVAHLSEAGFECELLGAEEKRPNLLARLRSGRPGPTLCYLGHVDTVLANREDWQHDPWSGEVIDGFMWGRGAIDMKSQVAAEIAASAALAGAGWRPARGELLIAAVVDEETGGELGAQWLTRTVPEKVRCDLLLNEGGGEVFEYMGQRCYGVCCAEKGVFRYAVSTDGAAAHASLPTLGENALLKMGPLLSRFAARQPSYSLCAESEAFLEALGEDPRDPAAAVARMRAADPRVADVFEPMFGITFSPTRIRASEKINVIPSHAELRVDCRVPPRQGEAEVRAAIAEVLGDGDGRLLGGDGRPVLRQRDAGAPDERAADVRAGPGERSERGYRIEFTERLAGNASPLRSELMDAISDWIGEHDPGAEVVPVILPGFSDSRHFRAAFPECVAYGFFPQRYQSLFETSPLIHGADERIDVRDLAFATEFFRDLALSVLG
jgi:acetylornithine deacetylase/succinyl-diaminopimelate desuccinylase-like protein